MIESDSNSEKVCKICYATDADFEGEWSKPCKCNGSIKVRMLYVILIAEN